MTAPVRRRIEQPSAEQAKRSGCLIWGAVLGVLAGIMVGMYALPPILKHYYGEKVVAAGEAYEGGGKQIRIASFTQASDPVGEAAPGMRREDFYAVLSVLAEKGWEAKLDQFTLEFKELDDWQEATDVEGGTLRFEPGQPMEVTIHFAVEYDAEETPSLTPEAVHLSEPRVKFEVPR